MTQEKKDEIRRKAEIAADDARFAWEYAHTDAHKDFKEDYYRKAEFYIKLSHAYSEILKADNHENL